MPSRIWRNDFQRGVQVTMRSGRKGISEIVAALLLILIVIAGSILVYVYSSGLLGSLQGAQPQQPYANQITLEYYDWTSTTTLTLTLRNVGSGRGILTDFFVGGQLLPLKAGSTCVTTTLLAPQSSCKAILDTSTLTISNGVAYVVKVVTRDGSVFSYSCIAGQSTGSLS